MTIELNEAATQLAEAMGLESGDHIFTWYDEVTGESTHYNVSKLERMVKDGTAECFQVEVPLDQHLHDYMVKNRGIENAYLERISEERLMEPSFGFVKQSTPTENRILIIDGHHRQVKRWRKGLKSAPVLIFSPAAINSVLVSFPKAFSDFLVQKTKEENGR